MIYTSKTYSFSEQIHAVLAKLAKRYGSVNRALRVKLLGHKLEKPQKKR